MNLCFIEYYNSKILNFLWPCEVWVAMEHSLLAIAPREKEETETSGEPVKITGNIVTKVRTRGIAIRNMGAKMTTTNPLVSLPVEIFNNILEYLGWADVGRLDTAYLNRETRNSYLFALQLRKVKVKRNKFWRNAVDRGILSWLIRRNIRVISWDLQVNNAQLISIANVLPQLQSLNISECGNITDAGIIALASGLPQLQSLNILGCMAERLKEKLLDEDSVDFVCGPDAYRDIPPYQPAQYSSIKSLLPKPILPLYLHIPQL